MPPFENPITSVIEARQRADKVVAQLIQEFGDQVGAVAAFRSKRAEFISSDRVSLGEVRRRLAQWETDIIVASLEFGKPRLIGESFPAMSGDGMK